MSTSGKTKQLITNGYGKATHRYVLVNLENNIIFKKEGKFIIKIYLSHYFQIH